MIVLGWLFAMMVLLSAIPLVINVVNSASFDAFSIGYVFGSFFFHLIFIYVSYRIVKKGIQLTRNKRIDTVLEKIDSIK